MPLVLGLVHWFFVTEKLYAYPECDYEENLPLITSDPDNGIEWKLSACSRMHIYNMYIYYVLQIYTSGA